jgi:hypothetical protein
MSDSKSIQASGTMLYPSHNLRLMGVDSPEWINFDEEQADILKNNNANAIRLHIYSNYWINDIPAWTEPDNPLMKFQAKHGRIAEWLRQRGIRLIISGDGFEWNPPEGWVQMKADVIMNADGKGDRWIADYGDVIAKLQPYGIGVMNEPEAVDGTTYAGTMTQEQFFEAYRQFVIRAVNAWRAIKPDLVAVVSGCPFWDLKSLAANPIPLPNVIYGYHQHYCIDNTSPESYSGGVEYWNGQLAEGKAILYDYLLNTIGFQACLNAGMELCMIEVGAGNEANNAEVWIQDIYDFCKARNIGVLQHQFRPYPREFGGLLQEGTLEQPSGIWWKPVTLNSMGELWSRNMQG